MFIVFMYFAIDTKKFFIGSFIDEEEKPIQKWLILVTANCDFQNTYNTLVLFPMGESIFTTLSCPNIFERLRSVDRQLSVNTPKNN